MCQKCTKCINKKKGKRDANGNIVLTIADDFTNCGTRVESVLDEDGTVTDYVVSTINKTVIFYITLILNPLYMNLSELY